jgi:hypothetical protein
MSPSEQVSGTLWNVKDGVVKQAIFKTVARSLNEQDLRNNLQFFKVPDSVMAWNRSD